MKNKNSIIPHHPQEYKQPSWARVLCGRRNSDAAFAPAIIVLLLLTLLIAGCALSKANVAVPVADKGALVAVETGSAPVIDGKADDAAWEAVTQTTIALKAEPEVAAQNITLKTLYDEKNVYVLAEYKDASPLKFNKAWEYDGTSWKEGSYDDTLAFVWNMNDSTKGFNEQGFDVMTKSLKKGDDVFDFSIDISDKQPATGTADFWGW